MSDHSYDLAIVGAGPGGIAAARAASGHGLRVVVIDDQPAAGGQIFRQPVRPALYPPDRFGKKHTAAGTGMARVLGRDGVSHLPGAEVVGLQRRNDAGFTVLCHRDGQIVDVDAERVLIAAGCHDMAVPFEGWTLPGVMGAGGIQAMLKGHGVVPGKSVVLVGSHPLLLVIAAQLVAFGTPPQGVFFSQSPLRAGLSMRSPITALANLPVFIEGLKAYSMLRQHGVPVHFNRVIDKAEGARKLERITMRSTDGAAPIEMDCDVLGVGYGFTASTELLRQMGAECTWSMTGGGWIVTHDDDMQSSVPNLYVAGEVAGIGGAPTATVEGEIAGLAVAKAAGKVVSSTRYLRLAARRLRRRNFARLLQKLADPGVEILRQMRRDEAVLCRCECVGVGDFRKSLHDNSHLATLNAAKLLTRVGMGACQGRFCQVAATDEIAHRRGGMPDGAKPFAARFPVRPVPLTAFRLPADD